MHPTTVYYLNKHAVMNEALDEGLVGTRNQKWTVRERMSQWQNIYNPKTRCWKPAQHPIYSKAYHPTRHDINI